MTVSADVAGVIRSCGLFDGLEPDGLAAIELIGQETRFQTGQRVFAQGEPARVLYAVDSGRVALRLPLRIRETETTVTLEEKEAGAVIAWSALVPPHKFTLTAEAATDLSLVAFERAALEQVFAARPQVHLVLMKNLCRVIGSRVSLLEALLMRNLQRWVAEKYA